MRRILWLLLALLCAPLPPAHAEAASEVYTRAVVQSISQDGGPRVLIRLKILPRSKVPFTTLTFSVRDRQLVAGLRGGENVAFRAERMDGENVLTAIRVVPPCVRFQPCD